MAGASEWEFLHQQITALRGQETLYGNLIILEGEAGIGKSALLHALLARAQQLRLYTLSTFVADSADKMTPFQAWRPLLEQLFDLDRLLMESPQKQRTHVLRQFPTGPEERGYPLRALSMAPLLNPLLPLNLPDNKLTRPLQGEMRQRATHELLLRLLPMMLSKVNGRQPTLLVVDNGHLLDDASLNLLLALKEATAPTLLIIAMRTLPTPAYQQLQTAVAHRLRIGPVSPDQISRLVQKKLGAQQLSPALKEFIQEKGGGHPLFSLALATTMQRTQLLRLVNGEAQLLKHARQAGMLPLPPLVQKTITHSLDRLPPTHELLLKRASTLNETFTYSDLQATYSNTAQYKQLPHHLDELVTLGILQREDQTIPSYRFSHYLGRAAVKSLLVSEQREVLGNL